MQLVLDHMIISARTFGMRFAPLKCNVMVQDCPACVPLNLGCSKIEIRLTNLLISVDSVSCDGSIDKEIDMRDSKSKICFC